MLMLVVQSPQFENHYLKEYISQFLASMLFLSGRSLESNDSSNISPVHNCVLPHCGVFPKTGVEQGVIPKTGVPAEDSPFKAKKNMFNKKYRWRGTEGGAFGGWRYYVHLSAGYMGVCSVNAHQMSCLLLCMYVILQ